jgi:hypothetical protein
VCELCSPDKEAVSRGLEMRAEQLERMAAFMRAMGSGRIRPHTKETEPISIMARTLLRFLVEDWL